MKIVHWPALALAALLAPLSPACADEVMAAVAANFAAPMQSIAQAFERDTGHKVVASVGSTGSLYAQIKNGAPFDLFLAADEETPTKLVAEHSAVAATQLSYAMGKLVLWSANPAMVDAAGEVLKAGRFEHLAIADPRLAPYGAAAVQTMKALGVYDALQAKLVTAQSIAQSHQFVQSGNAQLGFVALSQVQKDGRIDGSAWLVPPRLHQPIRQDAVLLNRGSAKAAAQAFLKFLKGDKAQAIIKAYGYDLP